MPVRHRLSVLQFQAIINFCTLLIKNLKIKYKSGKVLAIQGKKNYQKRMRPNYYLFMFLNAQSN